MPFGSAYLTPGMCLYISMAVSMDFVWLISRRTADRPTGRMVVPGSAPFCFAWSSIACLPDSEIVSENPTMTCPSTTSLLSASVMIGCGEGIDGTGPIVTEVVYGSEGAGDGGIIRDGSGVIKGVGRGIFNCIDLWYCIPRKNPTNGNVMNTRTASILDRGVTVVHSSGRFIAFSIP